ncbi:unnamed protein product [Rodentolepis nana]|uniref:C3H1-type domain-containing protein n=1 Tax=Rodentolepis nana TaxID=102285 RepID=A0A0R3TD79_RODNA|nr:unnamed protein product [Rodentolepis nana]
MIYKSTKCNDVLNSGYCPRGPFCAFAHADSEMTLGRTFLQSAAAAAAVAATATGTTAGLQTASPMQHDASPVSSSTSASSSGVFSPGIRPTALPTLTSLRASHTFPTTTSQPTPFCYQKLLPSPVPLGLRDSSKYDVDWIGFDFKLGGVMINGFRGLVIGCRMWLHDAPQSAQV